jgi:hypothetical protein
MLQRFLKINSVIILNYLRLLVGKRFGSFWKSCPANFTFDTVTLLSLAELSAPKNNLKMKLIP